MQRHRETVHTNTEVHQVSLADSHGQHRNTGYSCVYVHTQYVATQPRGETERGSGRYNRHPVCHNAKWSAHATLRRVDSCVRSIAMKIASDGSTKPQAMCMFATEAAGTAETLGILLFEGTWAQVRRSTLCTP